METFLREPDLFDTYIAFDPSLWWNKGKLVDDAQSMLKAGKLSGKSLYVAGSSSGGPAELGEKLKVALEKAGIKDLSWRFVNLPAETHATIYHPAALQAFRALFKPPVESK